MIMVNPVVSSCGARGCIDVHDPVRIKKLKEWAESDAKFLKRLSIKKHEQDHHQMMMILNNNKKKSHEDDQEEEGLFRLVTSERSESLDRFTFRQRYLRSYTFCSPNKEDNSKHSTIKKIIIKKLLPKKKKKKSQKEALNNSSRVRHCFNFLLSCVAQVHVHAN